MSVGKHTWTESSSVVSEFEVSAKTCATAAPPSQTGFLSEPVYKPVPTRVTLVLTCSPWCNQCNVEPF